MTPRLAREMLKAGVRDSALAADAALEIAATLITALTDPRHAFDERVIAPLARDLARRLVALGYLKSPNTEPSNV